MTGTDEGARTAFYARYYAFLLCFIPHVLRTYLCQEIWFKSHRTGSNTLGATDAGFGFGTTCLLFVHNEQTTRTLCHGNIQRDQSLAHHRTATDNLACIGRQTTTLFYQLREWSAQTSQEVGRILHALACYGDDTGDEGLVLHYSFIDGKGCTHILHHGTNTDGDSWRSRNLTTYNGIYQLLLTTLGILYLQGDYLYLGIRLHLFLHQGDGIGFVVLYADIATLHANGLHYKGNTNENLICLLEHKAVV